MKQELVKIVEERADAEKNLEKKTDEIKDLEDLLNEEKKEKNELIADNLELKSLIKELEASLIKSQSASEENSRLHESEMFELQSSFSRLGNHLETCQQALLKVSEENDKLKAVADREK